MSNDWLRNINDYKFDRQTRWGWRGILDRSSSLCKGIEMKEYNQCVWGSACWWVGRSRRWGKGDFSLGAWGWNCEFSGPSKKSHSQQVPCDHWMNEWIKLQKYLLCLKKLMGIIWGWQRLFKTTKHKPQKAICGNKLWLIVKRWIFSLVREGRRKRSDAYSSTSIGSL